MRIGRLEEYWGKIGEGLEEDVSIDFRLIWDRCSVEFRQMADSFATDVAEVAEDLIRIWGGLKGDYCRRIIEKGRRWPPRLIFDTC